MSIVRMDRELERAAESGDVSFLRKAIASQPPDYFLSLSYLRNGSISGNILHLATWESHVEFLREAIERLPVDVIQVLLSQLDKDADNPLHYAACKDSLQSVRLILGFYRRPYAPIPSPIDYDQPRVRPCLALNMSKKTPLHEALCEGHEEIAMEIMSMDMELLCEMVDKDGNSPLFLAVKNGCNQVAEKILRSSFSYSVSGNGDSEPCHVARFYSDDVLRLLLAKHQDLFDVVDHKGFNVVQLWAHNFHIAARDNRVDFFKEAIETSPAEGILKLLSQPDKNGNNALHHAAFNGGLETIRFINGCFLSYARTTTPNNNDLPRPWLALDNVKKTPLHNALCRGYEESAMEILSMDMELLCDMVDKDGNSPLFLAVDYGCNQVAEKILRSSFSYSVSGQNGLTPLHVAPHSSDIVLRLLLAKHQDLLDVVDHKGFNVLHRWEDYKKVEFFFEAIKRLPAEVILVLLSKPDNDGEILLHKAAANNNREIIRFILDFHRPHIATPLPNNKDLPKPWLALSNAQMTPLHSALYNSHEESAMEIMSMDMELLCEMVDADGNSPLFLAVKNGCNQVAEKILRSSFSYSVCGENGSTTLHVAPRSSVVVLRLLLAKHQDLFDVVDDEGFSVLHRWGKVELLKEAMKILPADVMLALLSKPDNNGENVVHQGATHNDPEMIQLILDFYRPYTATPSPDNKYLPRPWLARCIKGRTPLHSALCNIHTENIAMEILSMDMELLCNMVDKHGNSPLFLAVQNRCNQVAEKILKSCFSYSVSGERGYTPLHVASDSSDDVLRLLLAKHEDLLDVVASGSNVLHTWTFMGGVRPLNLLLKDEFPSARSKVFKDLITYKINSGYKYEGETPLHIAVKDGMNEFGRTLVEGCLKEIRAATTLESHSCPWKIQNKHGNTPLHEAILRKQTEFALLFLANDSTSCQILNNRGESPLFTAVGFNFPQVVQEIFKTQDLPYTTLYRSSDGVTLLHLIPICRTPENIGKRLLEKFWWMMNMCDVEGRTALDYAKERDTQWLVNFLMKPSLIQKEPFDWIKACERPDETPALLAFIDSCFDFQAICRAKNDTPLHHIKLHTYADYIKFLKVPSIAKFKNVTDSEGATPLHRALQRKDLLLAKILLTDNGVERIIEDNQGTTAMEMLAKLFKEDDEWAKMCKEIKLYPCLRTLYIKPGTNLGEMRNTLSVVAALLATITFAAGFTLPGGLNQETGDAILAKRVAFLVFLLSDAYAMCTSMLVLFCLIWSMVSARDMSYFLVDRSVLILMQALYGTIMAFMTGIYVVIERSSMWAGIIIFIMCSFIGISSNRTFLDNVLAKYSHQIYRDRTKDETRDQTRLLEEGKAVDSGDDNVVWESISPGSNDGSLY